MMAPGHTQKPESTHTGSAACAHTLTQEETMLKNFTSPAPMSLVQQLKETYGRVEAGKEPWLGIRSKQLLPNTAMAHRPGTGRSLAIVQPSADRWTMVEWDGVPAETLEASLTTGTPSFQDLFKIPGMSWGGHLDFDNAADASRAFVRWCKGE